MENIKEKSKIFTGLSVLATLYLFYIAVLAPAYTAVCNDILYIDTLWPDIIELAREAVDIVCFAIICAVFLYGCISLPSEFARIYLWVTAVCLFRYLLGVVLSWIFDGFPVSVNIAFLYIGEALLYFIFDMLQITAIVLLSRFALRGGKTQKNIRLGAVFGGGVISAVRIFMRIRYDVFYGAPESAVDLMWMVAYYTSDLLFGALVCLLALLVANRFLREKKNPTR